MAGSPLFVTGGKHLAEQGRSNGLDPFGKIHFLYIMFPPIVKAPKMRNAEWRMRNEMREKSGLLFRIPNSAFVSCPSSRFLLA
jgi:hypothetical protein